MKKDDIVLISNYSKITFVNDDSTVIHIENLYNPSQKIKIEGKDLIDKMKSADFWTDEQKLGLINIATKLVEAGDNPFTVCFLKANGDERILRGRLLETVPLLGRSTVEDFDAVIETIDANGEVDSSDRIRQVDHRTIKWLIINKVKYICTYKKDDK